MYDHYLLEKADDIKRMISKLTWVKEYQIFLQAVKEVSSLLFEESLEHTRDTVKMGFALNLISNSNRIGEYRYSLSNIDSITEISEPRTGSPTQDSFSQMKIPNAKSIAGDYSKSIDMDQNPAQVILDKSQELIDDFKIPFSHEVSVSLENRVILNQSDVVMMENSLRTNYQISSHFMIRGDEYNLSRTKSGRSLDMDFNTEVNELVNACIIRFKSRSSVEIDNPVIVLHPNVIGGLLSNYFYNTDMNLIYGKALFDTNIQVYDDPLRRNGYFSHLFDDEGTLCKSIQLGENGVIGNRLSTSQGDEQKGGNGYRVDAFQPRRRSYEFPVRKSFSNLVISGGAGIGEYFHERPGSVLVVKQGYTSPGVSSVEGNFILYVTEAEMYDNGDLVGPVSNLSIRGRLLDILSSCHFSADSSSYLDPSFPMLVNTGWISIPHSLVSIQ